MANLSPWYCGKVWNVRSVNALFSNFIYPKMKTPKPNDLVESKLRGHNKHCRLQRNCRGNVAVVYHIFCFLIGWIQLKAFKKVLAQTTMMRFKQFQSTSDFTHYFSSQGKKQYFMWKLASSSKINKDIEIQILVSGGKVHIFWGGHKILWNLRQLFDWQYIGQKIGGDFGKFCGLLRIYEL